MADDDMEVGPTCTAEELAAQRYEAAKAKGDVLELSSDDEDEPEAVRDFRRMMQFVAAQRAGGGGGGD